MSTRNYLLFSSIFALNQALHLGDQLLKLLCSAIPFLHNATIASVMPLKQVHHTPSILISCTHQNICYSESGPSYTYNPFASRLACSRQGCFTPSQLSNLPLTAGQALILQLSVWIPFLVLCIERYYHKG